MSGDGDGEVLIVGEDFPTRPADLAKLPTTAREKRLKRTSDDARSRTTHQVRVDEAIFIMSSGRYHSAVPSEYAKLWAITLESARAIFKEASRAIHRFDDMDWIREEKSSTIAELKQIARLATDGKQYAAAVAALREAGDVAGTKITRIEVTHVNKAPPGLTQDIWESNSPEAQRQIQRHVLLQILKEIPKWPEEEKKLVLCDLRGCIVKAEADEWTVEAEAVQGS